MNGTFHKQFNGTCEKLNGGRIHEDESQIVNSEISSPPLPLLSNQNGEKTNGQHDIYRKCNERLTMNGIKTDKADNEKELKESEFERRRECQQMEARVKLEKKAEVEERKGSNSMDEKKTEEERRRRTESLQEKEKPGQTRLEKRDEEEDEGRIRAGSMQLQLEKKREEKDEKPRQMGRQRSETRSEQLSQVIGGHTLSISLIFQMIVFYITLIFPPIVPSISHIDGSQLHLHL